MEICPLDLLGNVIWRIKMAKAVKDEFQKIALEVYYVTAKIAVGVYYVSASSKVEI